jgi:isopenicillin-N epimerase
MEREPFRFLAYEREPLLENARDVLASFLGADREGLVFVNNATTGVNTVLRSLDLSSSDEILLTDHTYSACLNAAKHIASRTGAKIVTAHVPFPLESPEIVYQAVVQAVTPRTRLALIDHVTSPTGLVFPIDRIARALEERGVSVLVDGAHGPGMVDVDIESIGASWYAGNCHKWLCAPKGAAFLWVREDKRAATRPLVISLGRTPGKSVLHAEFDWVGTQDPTAVLCIPKAIEWLGAQVEGGWPALRNRNRELLIRARRLLLERWSIAPPCPESMLGMLASIRLSDTKDERPGLHGFDSLHSILVEKHRIQVPVTCWPAHPKRLIRISAHLYNHIAEYEALAAAVAG